MAALLDSEAFSRALGAANVAAADGLPRLVARALTAWGLARVPGGPDTVPRETREAVVDALVDGLGGEPRGLGGAVSAALSLSSRIRDRRLASRLVTARRGALTGLTLGFAGDVLSYLVRGRAVRAYVADRLRELPRPVVLLGHSLGGVVAFDLLASGVLGPDGGPDGSAPSVPPVDLLVTVGSQAPLLYELDALPSRPFGAGLPAGFPPWINIYDPRDLLSFLASGVFGDQVRDIAVDNGHPVWAAHTSYFANPEVYRLLARAIPEYRT
ncbi:hypothetical protein AQ490_08160 [Wenjunlia vitaminophila]|uniref:Uncharacterized protein n=1 Tax=Wenjunlia vitaminophila TaxID=76728 RepID=A0A0T6LNI5_WENVI|nr:hypothetical protein [Wenjunlia vitaminophila]KRV47420.1 hypothetical protein AQ490_08160 [Wenjunlia vitaminophila]